MLNKKQIWFSIFIILAIVFLASVFLFVFKGKKTNKAQNKPILESSLSPKVVISPRIYFDPAQGYPTYFPQDLPLDKPLDITDNSQIKITYSSGPSLQNNSEMGDSGNSEGSLFLPNKKNDPKTKIFKQTTTPQATTSIDSQKQQAVYIEDMVTYETSVNMETSAAAYTKYFKDKGWKIVTNNNLNTMFVIAGEKIDENLNYTYSKNSVNGKNYITLVYKQPVMSDEEQNFVKSLQNNTKK